MSIKEIDRYAKKTIKVGDLGPDADFTDLAGRNSYNFVGKTPGGMAIAMRFEADDPKTSLGVLVAMPTNKAVRPKIK